MVDTEYKKFTTIEKLDEKELGKNDNTVQVLSGKTLSSIDSTKKSINITDVNTKTVDTIHYDYLVLATGTSYEKLPFVRPGNDELTFKQRLAKAGEGHKQLSSAKHVLIVGGGSVGCEVMADLAVKFPKLKITLVHSKDRLLERAHIGGAEFITQWIEKANATRANGSKINVILNDSVLESDPTSTSKGVKIGDSDLSFYCLGARPNSKGFDTWGIPLDSAGRVIVTQTLQVEGKTDIFCVGDVNNLPVEKSAASAKKQVKDLVDNLVTCINAGSTKVQLKEHQNAEFMQMVYLAGHGVAVSATKTMMKGKLPGTLKKTIEKTIVKALSHPNSFTGKMMI
jgi:NADH dehydrogenase FAD-containing subunit